MGDTGPAHLVPRFYDLTPDIEGGLPGTPEEDKIASIEIELRFAQFNPAKSDGTLLATTMHQVLIRAWA